MDPEQPPLPNFSLLGFVGLVEIVMTDGQMTREEAIKSLTEYEGQANAQNLNPQFLLPPGNHASVPPQCEHMLMPPLPLQPQLFNPMAKVASSLLTRPADYALKQLENYKYVHMWYFIREGLQEAAKMAAEGSVTNAKLNHNLSFSEYMFAKNHFMSAIKSAKWGDKKGDHGEFHQDWHDRATWKEAYNIGLINEELLASIE
ncbi:hypothetical protein V8B97DRAFT_2025268 [Scleroderma yunnanense]